ncbi:MFS transporter [Nonomuraea glycinis]|uniref:MFS transporter n=1 Tax=Nonomuraea glycinis TaxID=2047744 RepID=UPI002E0ED191|nr:MFS transporter [Nonomuraea glycinis]
MTGRSLRPLGGVLAAMAVSLTGTRVSAIALPWFVLVTTGSAVQTGLVAFCEMAPYVLVKALSGPLVDRVGPRRISWITDVVSAAATGAVVALHGVDALAFGPLLGMVAVIGAARGPGDLAKEIMVPEAAERGLVPLERATGLAGVTERLAGTVGPAAGGALVALLGPLAGLGVSAACFALGSVIVAWALPAGVGLSPGVGDQAPGVGHRASAREERAGYWRRFAQGCRFLRGERLLLALIVMIGVTNLLDAAFASVLLPVWGRESGHGPAMIGVNSGVMGLAAVGGSLVAAAVAHRMRRRVVFFVAFLVAGAPRFLILAVDAPVWAMVAVFAVSGFSGGFLNPILAAVWYERVPRHLLGRVSALGDSLGYAGIPLGGLLAGAAVAWAGPAVVLVACGVAYFLATNLTALRPEWREMDRLRGRGRPAVPEGAGTAG